MQVLIHKMPPTIPNGKETQPTFGLNHVSQEMSKKMIGNKVLYRKTMDIIELENGKTIVIGTDYEGPKIANKVLTLWDKSNNWMKTVVKTWFSESKKPTVLTLTNTNNKLDKIV